MTRCNVQVNNSLKKYIAIYSLYNAKGANAEPIEKSQKIIVLVRPYIALLIKPAQTMSSTANSHALMQRKTSGKSVSSS